MAQKSSEFGTAPLGQLLRQQAIPAAIGMLVMSIYGIVDTIFLGNFIDRYAIGAVTVVLPIQFLMSSIGMAIGVGGASVISRALGNDNREKAEDTFGNQIMLVLTFSISLMILGLIFSDEILQLFGAEGKVMEPARIYFRIILVGIPFLAWAMMSNHIIRAEGYPRSSMMVLLVPAILNIALDPLFIVYFDWGIDGAAWATCLSFIASALYTLYFFIFGKSSFKIRFRNFVWNHKIIREISSIGSVTLARQGVVSILSIVLNNSLVFYGGELALASYGVVNRVMLFAIFPILGITQGFVPIAGYNYGAKLYERVRALLRLSIWSATLLALVIFALIMVFTPQIIRIFTNDPVLVKGAVPAMRFIFMATPLIAINMISSAYFQAIGKALPALFLTLSKQGFFLIPLVFLLPLFLGLNGIWYAFPLADALTAIVSYFYYRSARQKLLKKEL